MDLDGPTLFIFQTGDEDDVFLPESFCSALPGLAEEQIVWTAKADKDELFPPNDLE